MIRPRPRSSSALWCLALLVLLIDGRSLSADTVHKKDGGKIRGQIVEESTEWVKIKAYGSVITVPRSEIQRVERDGDVREDFQSRYGKLAEHDEDGWMRLGEWCQESDLLPESIDCFYRVIAINPENAGARFELGHKKLKDKWLPAREYFQAKGYIQHNGFWITKEDKEKYDSGLVKDGEEWVTIAEYERRHGQEQGANSASAPSKPKGGKGRTGTDKGPEPRNPFGFGGNPFLPGGPPRQDVPETAAERKAFVASEQAKGSWQRGHMSKYYNFFSNGPELEIKVLADAMDKACVTFKKIFAYDKDIVRSFPIYMYASQQEFGQRTGRGQGVGGYYTSNGQIWSFHSPRAQGTLFHEGTHQFQGLALGQNMWTAKIWFIEGLATYFEGSQVRAKEIDTSLIPKDRLAAVKRAIAANQHIPIATLIQMEQAEFGALHYAHAWSLIHFFVNGTKGGRERFKQYFNGVKEGKEGSKLFEECFNKPIPEIERAWLDYVKNLNG